MDGRNFLLFFLRNYEKRIDRRRKGIVSSEVYIKVRGRSGISVWCDVTDDTKVCMSDTKDSNQTERRGQRWIRRFPGRVKRLWGITKRPTGLLQRERRRSLCSSVSKIVEPNSQPYTTRKGTDQRTVVVDTGWIVTEKTSDGILILECEKTIYL